MDQNANQDINLNFNYLYLNTIFKLRDAKAEGRKFQAWHLFEFATKLVINYMSPEIREKMHNDFRLLDDEIKRIKQNKETAEAAKKQRVDDLRFDFIERHDSYVLAAMSKVGIITQQEDGIIDFKDMPLENWAAIVQEKRLGLDKSIKKETRSD